MEEGECIRMEGDRAFCYARKREPIPYRCFVVVSRFVSGLDCVRKDSSQE